MTNVTTGLRFQYETGAYRSDVWVDESAKCELTLTDKITARTRLAEITVFNPASAKDAQFTKFQRFRLIEPQSNTPIFLGRLDVKEQDWDDTYGQVLKLTSRDYLSILTDRYEYDDRRSVTGSLVHYRRSDMIRVIIHYADKYSDLYWFNPPLYDSYSEFPDVGGYQGRDYRGSKLSAARVIEDLATEDPRVDSSGGLTDQGWDYFVDDGLYWTGGKCGFWYFPRYAFTVPITFTHKGLYAPGVIPIFPDYKFSEMPIEHKNLCIVRTPNVSFDVEVVDVADLLNQNKYHTVKEMILEDASIPDVAAAFQRGRAELAKTRNPPLRGVLSCQFYPTYVQGAYRYPLRAGQTVQVDINEAGLLGEYLVLALVYKEPAGITEMQLIRRGAGADEVLGVVKEDPLNIDKRLRDMDKEIKNVSWTVYAP